MKLIASLYSPFIACIQFFNQSTRLEKLIIAGSVLTLLFILMLIALGSVFLLALNGYNGYSS